VLLFEIIGIDHPIPPQAVSTLFIPIAVRIADRSQSPAWFVVQIAALKAIEEAAYTRLVRSSKILETRFMRKRRLMK